MLGQAITNQEEIINQNLDNINWFDRRLKLEVADGCITAYQRKQHMQEIFNVLRWEPYATKHIERYIHGVLFDIKATIADTLLLPPASYVTK